MNDKMTRKDMIAFKIATMSINIRRSSTYLLLQALERKYQTNYEVKKAIVEYFVGNDMLKDAEDKQTRLCLTYRKFEDFCSLLALSFATKNMVFLVFHMRILDWVVLEEDKQVLERIAIVLQKYTLEVNYDRYISESVIIQSNKTYNQANEYAFNNSYNNLLHNIQKNDFKTVLMDIKTTFKALKIADALQILIYKEKTEMLYWLAKKNIFFEKYYTECTNIAKKGLIKSLETILLIKSEAVVNEFVTILKEKKASDEEDTLIAKDDMFCIRKKEIKDKNSFI